MASSSTTSVQKSFMYDVFLSFRGEDTRKTFVDHLYHALQNKSIHTYKDDEKIKKGERINDELIKSIEDSKFYIIIFSKNYTSSSWCLDELVKIIECQKTTEHTAYPVFYDVEPTEVRKQSGEFGKAFGKQEKKETAEKWREALKEASDLAGWELKNTLDGHEAKFIQKIVEEISLELRSMNFSVDENLIGMEDRMGDIVSALEIGLSDVRMIGIKGMGGAGKTTLARAVFDHISFQFDGSSFVENVRENSNPNFSGLKKLQEQVLKDVLNDWGINISSVHDGKRIMKKMMHCRKVLIVLDDVDHIDQLKALAGELNWFDNGSRIIITTRDEQVLVARRVNLIRDVNLLSDEEALCLFSRYTFGREIPIQGYEELSSQVVFYAAGLPLTITVLGSFLCGKDEVEWKDAIKRLKTIPLKETLEKLELSYIGLEEDYKEIFLDVVCIMKGWKKENAIRALESCGFCAKNGLKVLEQKSLITISKDGELDMHDRIEEMGQYIVRRLHPEEPNKHSRLWIQQEIEDILVSDQGTNEAVRCIKLNGSKLNPEIVMKGLGNMKKLRFLQVYIDRLDCSNWEFDEVRQYFPNALRCLRWDCYPFGSLPKSFQANNLVQLQMPYSSIVQLWEGGDKKVLNNHRFLDLSFSKKLKNFDLGLTPNLETLDLEGCSDLVELHMPAECPKLISLKHSGSKFSTLDLRKTPNLETLDLRDCPDFVELHIPVECLKLRYINFYFLQLRILDLGLTPNLETLSVVGCDDLEELHIPIECLKLKSINIYGSKLRTLDLQGARNLETLRVENCVDLEELHIPVECLKLKSINTYNSKLRTLDLRGARNLETLRVGKKKVYWRGPKAPWPTFVDPRSHPFTSLHRKRHPVGIRTLVREPQVEVFTEERWPLGQRPSGLQELHIPVECLKLESIYIEGSKLRTLDLRGARNLETLRVEECVDLEELHIPVECLKLESIYIDGSKLRTLDLRGARNLKTLRVEKCVDLEELHIPVECLKLKSINIYNSKLRTLDLRGARNLETLRVENCVDLEELHIPVECLKLESIYIDGSKLRTLDLRGARNLKTLCVEKCVDLEELHIPVECLKLKSINIYNSKLRTLDIRGARNLETLRVENCVDLEELHIPVECLKLESIYIDGSKLRTLDLRGARNLETLRVEKCVDLEELHIPVECLKLESIDIAGSKLRTLDLQGTRNLETLWVAKCVDLEELHIPVECLKLESISIVDGSKLRTLDLRGARNLETLRVENCVDLEELHIPVECLKLKSINIYNSKLRTLDLRGDRNLETLRVEECVDLEELHIPVECLKLESIYIDGSKLRTLDLRGARNLETLRVEKCVDLEELHIPVECLKLRYINIDGSKLRTLDLRGTPNLMQLSLTESCYHLVEVYAPVGCLKKLARLDLSGCLRFKSFEFMKRSESLEVGSLSELHLIAESLDMCQLHSNNNLPKFQFICSYKEDAPSLLGNLEKLLSIGLCACTNLENFSRNICGLHCLTKLTLEGSIEEAPKDLDQLECLLDLRLWSTKITHLPDIICKLKHLKRLEVKSCYLLEKLPEDLGLLECLEELILWECTVLQDIPNSICDMKHLEYFDLLGCTGVEKLPEEIGRLICLKGLLIEGTNIRRLPDSIFELKGLRVVWSKFLLELCGFTSEIQTIEDRTFYYVDL